MFPLALKFFRKDPFESIPLALRPEESARRNGDLLEKAWKEGEPSEGRLLRSLRAVFGTEYACLGLYKVFILIVQPIARLDYLHMACRILFSKSNPTLRGTRTAPRDRIPLLLCPLSGCRFLIHQHSPALRRM
jgi:hypothetical protein